MPTDNIIKAKVFLACSKDPDAKASLHHVLFENGYAIATDQNVLVAYCLKNDLSETILKYLDGKMLHKDQMKHIMHQIIEEPTKDHTKRNQLPIFHSDLGHIIIELKDSFGDDLFPEWKTSVPKEGTLKPVEQVGIDIDKFNLVCKAMLPKNAQRNMKLKFYGQAASVVIRPIEEEFQDSYSIIGSYQFK